MENDVCDYCILCICRLDVNGDGLISEGELSKQLDISRREATSIIVEAKMQLYSKYPSQGDVNLTLEELRRLLAVTMADETGVSHSLPLNIKYYNDLPSHTNQCLAVSGLV